MNKTAPFNSHDDLQVEVNSPIIEIYSTGPWNVEYVEHLHEELVAAAKKLTNKHYAILLHLRGEALVVEQAIAFHLAFVKNGNTSAVAINLSETTTKMTSRTLFKRLYDDACINHAFFEQYDEAKAWLFEQLPTK